MKLHAEIHSKIIMHICLQIIFSEKYLIFLIVLLICKYLSFQNAELFNMSYIMKLFGEI